MQLSQQFTCWHDAAALADWWPKALPLPVDSWLGYSVLLIVTVALVWLVVALISRATDDIDPAEIDRQMLTAVNDLHRQGNLTQEEFRSIKSQLVERLADSAGAESDDFEANNDQQSTPETSGDAKAEEEGEQKSAGESGIGN
jgi:hypothetical protein